MTLTQAIRAARSEFPPVCKGRDRMWSYETSAPGALSCASRDYYAVVRRKNKEVIRYALVLFGWTDAAARAYVRVISGRGTYYEMMMGARQWRVKGARRQEAA